VIYYFYTLLIFSFLTGFLCWMRKDGVFKWIHFILLVTVINELFIIWPQYQRGVYNNLMYYNVFSLIDMTVWMIVFYKINPPYRRWIAGAYIICMAYSLVELLVIRGWDQLHTDSFRLYSITIMLAAMLYYYERLKEPYFNLVADPLFWIASACFLYHSLNFVVFTLHQRQYWKLHEMGKMSTILQHSASTFYYLLLSLSFVLCYFSSSRQARA
jgi:hypothetical protein